MALSQGKKIVLIIVLAFAGIGVFLALFLTIKAKLFSYGKRKAMQMGYNMLGENVED